MRAVLLLFVVSALAGCGLKSNTFKPDGHGYAEKREAHSGPVCLLPSALPAGAEFEVVGLVRGNRGFFGSFEPVRQVMADEARSAGADVIVNLSMRQDVAFRGVFILRPVGEGTAVKLKDPLAFNCLANGGRIYPGNGKPPITRSLVAPAPSAAGVPDTYDQCMARVLKIQDSALRLESMKMCDGAAK